MAEGVGSEVSMPTKGYGCGFLSSFYGFLGAGGGGVRRVAGGGGGGGKRSLDARVGSASRLILTD
jgi:hypothetical protein